MFFYPNAVIYLLSLFLAVLKEHVDKKSVGRLDKLGEEMNSLKL
jgi:hypothetical protein